MSAQVVEKEGSSPLILTHGATKLPAHKLMAPVNRLPGLYLVGVDGGDHRMNRPCRSCTFFPAIRLESKGKCPNYPPWRVVVRVCSESCERGLGILPAPA